MQELSNEEKIIRTIYSKYRINEHSKLMTNIGKTKNEFSARGVLNSSMYCSAVTKLWEDFILLLIEELIRILKANNKNNCISSNNSIVISLIDELLEESNKNTLNGASFENQYKNTQGKIWEKAINKWNIEADTKLQSKHNFCIIFP